jgi:hypothetical protein
MAVPNIHFIPMDLFYPTSMHWIMPKHASWNKDVNRAVAYARDMGMYKKFVTEEFSISATTRWRPDASKLEEPLAFDHIFAPTVVMVLGYFLAIAIFALELRKPKSKILNQI